MNEIERFKELARQVQEPQGYYFNADVALVDELIQGLLVNRKRYGYPSCPCRLASGVREKDRDIVCPCLYRAPDVREHGSCYCGLYVSAAFNAGEIVKGRVPERRPPERFL